MRILACLPTRGRLKGAAATFSRLGVAYDAPSRAVWSSHAPWCGYTTVAMPDVYGKNSQLSSRLRSVQDQFQKFLESQLEVVKDVDGAKFLRLPPFLCREWGYLTENCEPLLLKRDCYDVLNAKIDAFFKTPRAKSVVVLGSSGIGKSGYCLYLLWHLVKGNVAWSMIILKFAEGSGHFYIFTKDSDGNVVVNLEKDMDTVLWLAIEHGPGKVWYLADKNVPVVHWTLPGHCHFVLTCSPAKENHFHFSKYSISVKYYLPVWSKEEIVQLNKAVFKLPDQEVHKAFKMWGGVPRYVLANRLSDILLFSAIKAEAGEMVYLPGKHDAKQKEADYWVYHYDVDSTTCELHNIYTPLKFASEFVAVGVAKPLPPSLIDETAGGDAPEKLRAALFDTFFHRLLARSIPVSSREMDEQGKWGPVLNEDLPLVRFELIPKSAGNNAILPEGLPPFLLDCTMVRPESSSDWSWDLILGRRIFQATITSRRDRKKLEVTEGLLEASKFLRRCYGDGTKVEFIYFVPTKIFETFTPSLPGGVNAAARAVSVAKFTTELNVRVKKMCLRTDQSLAVVEALKAFNLLNLSASPTCTISRFEDSKTFDAMELRDNLLRGISDNGYKVPTLVQQKVIAPFSRGMNVLEQAPRGSGCTTALCIAVLQRVDLNRGPFQAVVLAASQNQALEIMRQMVSLRSNDVNLKIRSPTSLEDEQWHVLVGTPPDVYQVCNSLSKESLVSLSILGVDDVDEISKTLGLEEVRLLLDLMPEQRQLGIFGCKMSPGVLEFMSSEAKSLVC